MHAADTFIRGYYQIYVNRWPYEFEDSIKCGKYLKADNVCYHGKGGKIIVVQFIYFLHWSGLSFCLGGNQFHMVLQWHRPLFGIWFYLCPSHKVLIILEKSFSFGQTYHMRSSFILLCNYIGTLWTKIHKYVNPLPNVSQERGDHPNLLVYTCMNTGFKDTRLTSMNFSMKSNKDFALFHITFPAPKLARFNCNDICWHEMG